MKTLATITIATLFAFGCGNKDDDKPTGKPTPTKPTTTTDSEVDEPEAVATLDVAKVEAYMKATIAAIEGAGGDCTKLAEPVAELATQNADLLAQMAATNNSAQAEKWQADNPELFAAFNQAMSKVVTCAKQEPKLVEVLQAFAPQ